MEGGRWSASDKAAEGDSRLRMSNASSMGVLLSTGHIQVSKLWSLYHDRLWDFPPPPALQANEERYDDISWDLVDDLSIASTFWAWISLRH
jgi:hypothetical protein